MTVRLAPLTDADAEPTARWREAARANLRTPYVRSVEEQRDFIRSLPAHRYEYRYWAVQTTPISVDAARQPSVVVTKQHDGSVVLSGWQTVGIAGLSPIQWVNGIGEVSLVLNPDCIGKGYGGQAFALVLAEAFNNLRLEQVVAEVYQNNSALGFWEHEAEKRGAYRTVLPKRKYIGGVFYDSVYFSFSACRNGVSA